MKGFPTKQNYSLVCSLLHRVKNKSVRQLRGEHIGQASGAYKEAWLIYDEGLVLKTCKSRPSFDTKRKQVNDLLCELYAQHYDEGIKSVINQYIAWGEVDGKFYAVQPLLDTDADKLLELEDWFIGLTDRGLLDCDYPHNAGVNEDGHLLAFDWGYDVSHIEFIKAEGYYYELMDKEKDYAEADFCYYNRT